MHQGADAVRVIGVRNDMRVVVGNAVPENRYLESSDTFPKPGPVQVSVTDATEQKASIVASMRQVIGESLHQIGAGSWHGP